MGCLDAKRLALGPGSPVEKILREGGKFGLAAILASQQPEDFSSVAFSNTATKIVFQVADQSGHVSRQLHRKIKNGHLHNYMKGLLRPHYVSWSEQQKIESHASQYLRNVVRIITETGLRIYKELILMRKDQVDLQNAVVWIPDSKAPNGRPRFPHLSPSRRSRIRWPFRVKDRICFRAT